MRIFCDFDETVTAVDTLELVAEAAYNVKPNFKPAWEDFGNVYMDDMHRFQNAQPEPRTIQEQIEFLGSLSTVELASVRRVEASGLLRGITESDLRKQGKEVVFRKGWWRWLEAAKAKKITIAVVSVNWSSVLIKSSLRDDDCIDVFANDVEMGEDGHATGALNKSNSDGIRTGVDKRRVMREQLQTNKEAIVCIGDSNTDIPSLLEADIGIIMGHNRSLQATCERIGITIIDDALDRNKDGPTLFRFEDWDNLLRSPLLEFDNAS